MRTARQILLASAITLAGLLFAQYGHAAEHVIEMRNKDDAGQLMAFQPAFIKVAVGDTVKFAPTDKNHNAESVKEIWPEGVATIKGAYSKEVTFTAEKEGLYFFKCLPHYGMGMVALVQVGKPANLDKFQEFKAVGLGHTRLIDLLKKVEP